VTWRAAFKDPLSSEMRGVFEHGLAGFLKPRGRVMQIGEERGRTPRNGIAHYVSPHGSHRYVLIEEGRALGALQVVTADGKHARVANVFVLPSSRRKGIATKLLARARRDFVSVEHAPDEDRSQLGDLWARGRGR
jgi:GNAT superfamily N-acetyltransferase